MITYDEFLNKMGVVSEAEFNSLVSSLPECDIFEVDFSLYDCEYLVDVATKIIEAILTKWNDCWVDTINLERHEITIFDVESVEDLNEIVETFKGWTILNYDEIKSEIESDEISRTERNEKMNFFESVIDNISLKELKKLLYDYSK